MPLPVLAEQLRAVAAGSDRVAKVLHAHYAWRRAEAMEREMEKAALGGASLLRTPAHRASCSRPPRNSRNRREMRM
jgi:hypothetical protein